VLASTAFVLFCLSDWVLLQVLPYLQISFSPGISLVLGASILVRSLVFGGLSGSALLSRWWKRGDPAKALTGPVVFMFLAVNVGFSAAQIDAYVVEPLRVETTELALAFDDLNPTLAPVRVAHITDTHIERSGFREAMVVQQISALQPDIIVLTGDYLNTSYLSDATALEHFQQFVGQLQAPHGIYAVRGSVEAHPQSMARLVEGTEITWLEQEAITVDVRGQLVTLVGVACSHDQKVDVARLIETMATIPEESFTLLLFHSPDLILEAAENGVDLYLGGHTHGGQLRLPLVGPIVTFSRYGRQYASGLFEVDGTTMYISRGLGFEGGALPRARFLCRPEIVSIELRGTY
jgi:predicted MPP superfamily phosphohydrolase